MNTEDPWAERHDLLRQAFLRGPGFRLRELCQIAGLAPKVMAPAYWYVISPGTRGRIAAAAAQLLHYDAGQFKRWYVQGCPDEQLVNYLRGLVGLAACKDCGGHFPADEAREYVRATRCCIACHNARNRRWVVAASPRQRRLRQMLGEQLPHIKNPGLRVAVAAAVADPCRAVTLSYIAELLGGGATPKQARVLLQAAGIVLSTKRTSPNGIAAHRHRKGAHRPTQIGA